MTECALCEALKDMTDLAKMIGEEERPTAEATVAQQELEARRKMMDYLRRGSCP